MEYRAAFIAQVLGMIANDFIYFIIWIIFFERFKDVRGWGISDMWVTYGVLASAFGLVSMLFGNTFYLSEIIMKGRLDYYLSLPRPVLLHTVSSRMIGSGMGDFTYGFISYGLSGTFTWDGLARFVVGTLTAAAIFGSFMIIVQSLSFWLGMLSNLSALAVNALITFGIYPVTLFDNAAKFVLFTVIPAAFIGALPASFVHSFSWPVLGEMALGSLVFLFLAISVFRIGLRRYESGSGMQLEV
jgi:ABC-2 type transport system permease protein